MGITSLGLGLLPTYATIGIFAPILMIVLRLTQGLAIGGELPSTIVYVSESMPTQRGIAIGTIFASTISGLLLGTLLNLLLTHVFTQEQMNHFGWRIPFLLGAVLCLIAYKVRRQLHETQSFSHLKKHFSFPLQELLQHHLSSLIIGIGLVSLVAASILLALIFMPTYLITLLGFAPKQVSLAISICTIFSVIFTYLTGCLADRFGTHRVLRKGIPIFILCAGACYFMLYKGVQPLLALPAFAILQGALTSLPLIILFDLFPTSIRLTGVALSYNIAFVLFGGLIPITMTALIEYTKRPYSMPFIAVIVVSVITLCALKWHLHRAK
jgi:MFS family permease